MKSQVFFQEKLKDSSCVLRPALRLLRTEKAHELLELHEGKPYYYCELFQPRINTCLRAARKQADEHGQEIRLLRTQGNQGQEVGSSWCEAAAKRLIGWVRRTP